MTEASAGLLLHRRTPGLEVLLVHMGGPFWARKDAAAWSIPKGLIEAGDDARTTALREFEEELGAPAPDVELRELGTFRYTSGKTVVVFSGESDFPVDTVRSNTFELEWPPRSGRMQAFPEVDRAEWFTLEDARVKLVAGQVAAIDALEASAAAGP